jgi:4-amino-4-deoxy-L-arabinose transferase-like glycosyltransferase
MPAVRSLSPRRSAIALSIHWPIIALLALGAVLVLTNLGRDHLWEDEGDTAVLAANVLKTGVPSAWDGVTFTESDHGQRLNDDLVMVSHPWLQYYLTAGSFALFGQSAFTARLPFALAGLATVLIVYLLTLRATGSRRAAISAALLLLLSVQFLIFSRQARHYSLHALLTCLLVWTFFRLRSWRSTVAFSATAIALFHTHPIALAAVGALTTLTLTLRPFAPHRRWCLRSLPFIAIGTLPWLLVASRGYGENTAVFNSLGQLAPRALQFLVECASVMPLVGIAVLLVVVWRQRSRDDRGRTNRRATSMPAPIFSVGERWLIITLLAIAAAEAAVVAASLSRDILWQIGMRYTPAFLPFAAMLAGLLVAKVARSRPVWIMLLLILGFTKLGRITPWAFWEEPSAFRDAGQVATFHQPPNLIDRVFRTGQVGFLASLVQENPGTIAQVTEFLREHSSPGDLVVTNYEWDSLYFHTGLPQAMKVPATDRSYSAARALGLPEYVFTPGRVRWIIWRPAWGDSWGQNGEQLVQSLTEAGVSVQLVKTVTETLWENRENIHFRRYPGNRYFYPWFQRVPDVQVYRVDWPGGT